MMPRTILPGRGFLEQAMSGVSDPKISVQAANDVKDGEAEIDPPAFAVWTDAAIEHPGWLRGVIEQRGRAHPEHADDTISMPRGGCWRRRPPVNQRFS
ncbi:MAG: hypothetical protein U0872_07205 [Planctomycetaceae bacterium]